MQKKIEKNKWTIRKNVDENFSRLSRIKLDYILSNIILDTEKKYIVMLTIRKLINILSTPNKPKNPSNKLKHANNKRITHTKQLILKRGVKAREN